MELEDPFTSKPTTKIHIRIQQRSSRQSLTLVEGLDSDLDLEPHSAKGTMRHCHQEP